ncbi:MAG: hypothetical protein U9N49_08960 [Campylobacterota bacterium]|nr:hypothetical protein [Campylobacterota bacterium]
MRYIRVLILLSVLLQANVYESNCKSCHAMEHQLQKFMHRYTLKYSSETGIKKALFEYMKNPTANNSIMPMGFINRWGVKKATTLDDKSLQEAINTYYRHYNLKKIWK